MDNLDVRLILMFGPEKLYRATLIMQGRKQEHQSLYLPLKLTTT